MDKESLDIVKAFTPTILGVGGIAITVIYNAANKRLNHQMMEKDLFKEFNERYDTLNEDLKKITQNRLSASYESLVHLKIKINHLSSF